MPCSRSSPCVRDPPMGNDTQVMTSAGESNFTKSGFESRQCVLQRYRRHSAHSLDFTSRLSGSFSRGRPRQQTLPSPGYWDARGLGRGLLRYAELTSIIWSC